MLKNISALRATHAEKVIVRADSLVELEKVLGSLDMEKYPVVIRSNNEEVKERLRILMSNRKSLSINFNKEQPSQRIYVKSERNSATGELIHMRSEEDRARRVEVAETIAHDNYESEEQHVEPVVQLKIYKAEPQPERKSLAETLNEERKLFDQYREAMQQALEDMHRDWLEVQSSKKDEDMNEFFDVHIKQNTSVRAKAQLCSKECANHIQFSQEETDIGYIEFKRIQNEYMELQQRAMLHVELKDRPHCQELASPLILNDTEYAHGENKILAVDTGSRCVVVSLIDSTIDPLHIHTETVSLDVFSLEEQKQITAASQKPKEKKKGFWGKLKSLLGRSRAAAL